MIKIISIIGSILLCNSIYGQESIARSELKIEDVPPDVIDGFYRVNPGEEATAWIEGHGLYQVEYSEEGKIRYDIFNESGKYIETKEVMPWSEAPQNLKEGLNHTEYKYWDVIESYHITDEGDNSYYTLIVRNKTDGSERTVYFDKNGTLEDKSKSGFTH